jgi:integrase
MPEAVTLDRLHALLDDDSIPVTHRILWLILWQSDIRLGDLLSLDVRDVDWEGRTLPVDFPKTERDPRRVRVSEQAIDGLREMVGARDSGPLFVAESGGPLSKESVARVAQRVGVGIHGFRLGGQQARSSRLARAAGESMLQGSLADS